MNKTIDDFNGAKTELNPVIREFLECYKDRYNGRWDRCKELLPQVWELIKDKPITGIKCMFNKNADKPTRNYSHIYIRTIAVIEGLMICADNVIYKGAREVHYIEKQGVSFFEREKMELYNGHALQEMISARDFLSGYSEVLEA